MSTLIPLALGALCVAAWLRKLGAREAGLPPGPPTLPILGNLHQMPTKYAHLKFTEWARQYGGLVSLKLGSGTAIIITDVAAVRELMDKRSASTADRPPIHLGEVVAQGLNLVLARYDDNWRILRKAAHTILTPQASIRHLPIQKAETVQLIRDILHTPEKFYNHMQRYSSSVILSVLYGKRSPRFETPETVASFEAEHAWVTLLEAGATPPMDFFPFLKYVPERWAKWKRDAANVRRMQRKLYFGLLDDTKERMRKGEGNGSYVEELVERQEELGMDREMTGYLSGVLIEAGSETTAAYLQSLVLALIAYPEAQKKAHEEIDRVVGGNRMPTLEDLDNMPYIRALILENHRFRAVATLLIPHCTLAAEEYKGYVIPKGATIFVNAWGIFHDPELFDDPESFIPDRYLLTENGTKPGVDAGGDLRTNLAFGVGRRICPGIHVAHHTINLNVMNLLWAFNFDKDIDADGNPLEVDTMAYHTGLTSKPMSFRCRITPRSEQKAKIIDHEFLEAVSTFSKYEHGLSPEDQEFVAKQRGGR
ncbi:cytochrome P450 [Mycena polygramma]|nr:cytochrome P450 [Mycena polygramma]